VFVGDAVGVLACVNTTSGVPLTLVSPIGRGVIVGYKVGDGLADVGSPEKTEGGGVVAGSKYRARK